MIQINLTERKARVILTAYVIGFLLLAASEAGTAKWILYLNHFLGLTTFYAGLLTIQIKYYPKSIRILREKNLLDLYFLSTFFTVGYLYWQTLITHSLI